MCVCFASTGKMSGQRHEDSYTAQFTHIQKSYKIIYHAHCTLYVTEVFQLNILQSQGHNDMLQIKKRNLDLKTIVFGGSDTQSIIKAETHCRHSNNITKSQFSKKKTLSWVQKY